MIDLRALVSPAFCGTAGSGVTLGLLDTPFVHDLSDLAAAELVARDFTDGEPCAEREHGTFSVAMLVAQGRTFLSGLIPRVRLLVGEVVGARGVAAPACVARAIDWLVAARAQVIALPLGQAEADPGIARAIAEARSRGVILFGAAGHEHLDGPLFPARHRDVMLVRATARMLPSLIGEGRLQERRGSSIECVVAAARAAMELSGHR